MKSSKSDHDKPSEGGSTASKRPRRKKGARSRKPTGAQRIAAAGRLRHQAMGEGKDLLEDARQFVQTLQEGTHEAHQGLRELSRERPYVVLGVAAAAGFVMGRRLPLSLTRTALLFAGRYAASALVRRIGQQVLS